MQFQPGLDYNIVNDSSLKYTEVDADKFPFKNICLLFLFLLKTVTGFVKPIFYTEDSFTRAQQFAICLQSS